MVRTAGLFLVGATEVGILNHSKLINYEELQRIVNIIKLASIHYASFVTHLPEVVFVITDKDGDGKNIVYGNETNTSAYVIASAPDLPIYVIAKKFLVCSKLAAIRVIGHELKHVYDFSRSEKIRLATKGLQRLHASVSRLSIEFNTVNQDLMRGDRLGAFTALRTYYGEFFRNLQLEGMATYVQYDPQFTIEVHQRLISNALHTAKNLANNWLEKDKLIRFIRSYDKFPVYKIAPYNIGLFLVYSLLYHRVKTLEQISQMSFTTFIETCEALQVKLGQPVLVSVTSRRGILDYAKLVEEARITLLSK